MKIHFVGYQNVQVWLRYLRTIAHDHGYHYRQLFHCWVGWQQTKLCTLWVNILRIHYCTWINHNNQKLDATNSVPSTSRTWRGFMVSYVYHRLSHPHIHSLAHPIHLNQDLFWSCPVACFSNDIAHQTHQVPVCQPLPIVTVPWSAILYSCRHNQKFTRLA